VAPLSRNAILAEARSWLATPYRHQASQKGAGADCLGLVRGIWRALVGEEPESLPAYTPDWVERSGQETLRDAGARWLQSVPLQKIAPGDVILFRMDAGSPAKHCAILDDGDQIIHAYWGRAVVVSRFVPWWKSRAAYAFSFPGASPWPS
jgi:NlpC/P60 family putative phage cell wall peptidase